MLLILIFVILSAVAAQANVTNSTSIDIGILENNITEIVATLSNVSHVNATQLITTTVVAPSGTYIGKVKEDGIRVWEAIRYGVAERFKSPTMYNMSSAAAPWDSNTANKTVCFQSKICFNGTCTNEPNNSEDCLMLKITAPPAPKDGHLYPVLIFIHGGSFDSGDCYAYDGSTFAKKGVIVVSMNYRLGLMGFLGSAYGYGLDGNYGFLDQRLAMRWVHLNIHAFGGNTSSVTLSGFSAGAMSAGAHLISPGSQGLFHKVIMDSANFGVTYTDRFTAFDQSWKLYNHIYNLKTGIPACQNFYSIQKCVSQVDPQILVDAEKLVMPANAKLPVTPLVDYFGEIPYQPYSAISAGRYNPNIPIFAGFNRDDGVIFVYPFTEPIKDVKGFHTFLENSFGFSIRATYSYVDKLYPFENTPGFDGRILANQIYTDLGWSCPLLKMMTSVTANRPHTPSYVYTLNHAYSSLMHFTPITQYCDGLVCHGFELPLLFNDFNNEYVHYTPTTEELQLSTNINNAWVNFVKTSNPNTGLPLTNMSFDAFNHRTPTIAYLDIENKSTNAIYNRTAHCNFWNMLNLYPN